MYRYIRCTSGNSSREITIHTVIYGADIRFWSTLFIQYERALIQGLVTHTKL